MPKRMLDSSYLNSPSLDRCSPRAQDSFPRFILIADDFGCFEVDPRKLVALGWTSRRTDVTESDVLAWIEEYADAGMACLWTENERRFCYLIGWDGPHGQRKRAEYDPDAPKNTPGAHGSKRRTPRPPAEMIEAIRRGYRRDHDGKTPGSNRECGGAADFPPGRRFEEKPNNSAPAREITGNAAEPRISAAPVPDPVPVPAAAGGALAAGKPPMRSFSTRGSAREARRAARFPGVTRLMEILREPWPYLTRPSTEQDELQLEARCATRGVMLFAHDCFAWAAAQEVEPKSAGLFASALDRIPEAPEPREPGVNPKPGDPDFNDPEAWSDHNAFQTRDADPVPVAGGAVRRIQA